jgi:hypothetical protein
VASITITRDGMTHTCSTSLVPNNRGPVVVIEIRTGTLLRGRVGVFPPYWLGAVHSIPGDKLESEVLKRFANDEYEFTPSSVLQRYEDMVAEGFDANALEVKARATFYVHPHPEA